MHGAPWFLVAVLALSVTLALGTPVPRVVDVDEETCRTLCEAVSAPDGWGACPPAAPAAASCCGNANQSAGSASPDFASGSDLDCETCLLCQCGRAIPAPPAPVLRAGAGEPRVPGTETSLASFVKGPASPPPRAA